MTENKVIDIDESRLKNAAHIISEQSEGFRKDLDSLYRLFEELPSFWSGEAANAFLTNMSADFDELESVNAVFTELAENYRFAVNEYERRAYRTMEVVRALNI